MTRDLLLNQRGSIVIMVVVTIAALLAFAVIAIDGAILMTSKTQLQAAADAAALAGASGLLWGSEDLATERAMDFSSFNVAVQDNQTPVVIGPGDVTFPEPDVCRVVTHRTAVTGDAFRTYFVRAIGGSGTADMTAVAAARAYDVCSSKCMKPWAIPDRWDDADGDGVFDEGETYDKDVTGYNAPADVGAQIVLKVGNPSQTPAPGIYYPVNYPPLDNEEGIKPLTGGSWYETWIADCEPYMIEPGDRLQVEPGNMVGPTMHGMEDLIAQDPTARWDPGTQSIVGSAYGKSPRIGLVPFFDPALGVDSGRKYVTVSKIGAFFIEDVTGGGTVTGRFIQITDHGVPCGTGVSNSLVKGIVLIQ
ncbi:MAG: pilus assembly protein TadG-related protein [bacterium]